MLPQSVDWDEPEIGGHDDDEHSHCNIGCKLSTYYLPDTCLSYLTQLAQKASSQETSFS